LYVNREQETTTTNGRETVFFLLTFTSYSRIFFFLYQQGKLILTAGLVWQEIDGESLSKPMPF